MAERISAIDPAVDELRRKARRRLVGAIVLALAAAVLLPMLLEKEPRPLGEDVSVRIPPVDEGKFVNRLSPNAAKSETPQAPANTSNVAPAPSPTSPATASTATAAPVPQAGSGSTSSSTVPNDGSSAEPNAKPAAPAPPASTPSAKAAGPTRSESSPSVNSSTASPSAPVAKVEPKSAPAVEAPSDAKPAAKASTSPQSATATKARPAEGTYVVQLAAFSDDKGANALASKLKRNGYPAYTEATQTSHGTLYRVRVGGYPSREAAGDARNKLKGDGYAGIVAPAR